MPPHSRTLPSSRVGAPRRRRLLAGLLSLTGLCASGLLVLEHLAGIHLPGCGTDSPCAHATASVWGRVPLLGWPVSFIALAWFAAITPLVLANEPPGRFWQWMIRLGATVSLGYLLVMLVTRLVCPYCVAVHVANLGLAGLVEAGGGRSPRPGSRQGRRTGPVRRPGRVGRWLVAPAVFALVTVTLGAADWWTRRQAGRLAETRLAQSTAQIIADVARTGGGAAPTTQPGGGFTGRYHMGPAVAPIRLVVISDYQCVDCQRIEAQIRSIMARRGDVSLSVKHFPFCRDCNPHVERTLHPNACWAARAAEAAGLLGGDAGFWKMHHWLFDRRGSFTDAELKSAVGAMGYDPQEFARTMESDETLRRVQADIEEAMSLGIHFTPMIFINGVELRGWNAPEAVVRAVDAVAAANPPAAGPERDRPVGALQKLVDDWRAQPLRTIPPDTRPHARGASEAHMDIIVFGDYQESNTAEVDAIIRRFVDGRADVRYTYRHYPLAQECNPALPQTFRELSCRAARAAEAAGMLAGEPGYWRMHEWLMASQSRFSDPTLMEAVEAQGMPPDLFLAAMDSPETELAILEDAAAGQRLGITSLPAIWINGRCLPRWTLGPRNVLDAILAAAASAAP